MRVYAFLAAAPLVAMATTGAIAADVLTDQQFEERYSGNAVSAVNAKIDFG